MRKLISVGLVLAFLVIVSACSTAAEETIQQSSQATEQVTVLKPEISLISWSMKYIPEDDFSDLEQYLFSLTFESSEVLTSDVGLYLNIDLLKDDEIKLSANTYFGDTSFNGLADFTLVVDFHNYILSEEQMDSVKDINKVVISTDVITLEEPILDGTPLSFIKEDKDKFQIVNESWGIVDDLLKIKTDNYPEIGAGVIYIKGKDPVIVPMSEDLSDSQYYSGYMPESVSMDDVEEIIICALEDARVD